MTSNNFDTSCIAQTHLNQEYVFHQVDQGTKYPRRSESQLQHDLFEWASKDFAYGSELAHYPHYSATSARESTQAPYTLENQFIQSGIDWSSYYRSSALADNTASASSTYESWYDDLTDTRASSVNSI